MRAGAVAIALASAGTAVLAASGDDWIISETTSPVDYSPMVTATALSRAGSPTPMQLSLSCRGGRTELVLTAPAIASPGPEQRGSYRINDEPPVPINLGRPAFGTGAAFKTDVARLLASFPDEGGLTIRMPGQDGSTVQAEFSLGGLKAAKSRVAKACDWSPPPLQTRN